MYLNLMQLIKEAPNGTTLRSTGGDRHRYERFVFVKTRKNTVHAFSGYSWTTINDLVNTHESAKIVCTLTPDKVMFKAEKTKNGYNIWNISSFLSLNLLYDCWTRYTYGQELIHTADFEFCPFAKMEFNWDGKLISKIPKTSQNKYNKHHKAKRDIINAQSRARYAQNKAEREFKKYDKAGNLDKYPVKNIFTLKNAQLRAIAIEKIGLNKVLAPYDTKIINKDTIDGRKYELVEIMLPPISFRYSRNLEEKACLYLKMINPSTGEFHLEGVPRKSDNSWDHIPEETVAGALAWRDGEQPERQPIGTDGSKLDWAYQKPTIIT